MLVRRSTATKVMAGLFLVIALGSLLSGEGRRMFPQILLVAAVVAGALYLTRLRERPRQEALRDEADRRGLTYSKEDPFGILDEPFALFRRTAGRYGEVDNVLAGSWHGLEIRAFDYSYSESEDRERRISAAMAVIPGIWPSLEIRAESLLTSAADVLGAPDIRFESEAFNRAFEVRSPDRRFASAVVDARMMEWLLGLSPPPGLEISGHWILAYGDEVRPWEIDRVLGLLESFIGHVPQSVSSLYPAAPPPRPDAPERPGWV